MRWADFTPTPGRRLRASINASSDGSAIQRPPACRRAEPTRTSPRGGSKNGEIANLWAVMSSERELHSRRQWHAGGELAHLFLRHLFGTTDAVVERGSHEVFEHVLVVGQQARVDDDAFHVVLAGHRHLHEPGAGLPFDLDAAELFLSLLEVVLHRLRLLHQACELV